jgi:hypothetical protein
MNCVPVIERELRSAAQRRWTVWLRLAFALVGMAACMVVLSLPKLSSADKGQVMLVILTGLSFLFCLFAGGFLTADCVSREKRDGTLGLLFLTPLSGIDIVVGKMACHSLQTFYGICAAAPIFFLPLFAGGVTGGEVCRILLALGLTLLLAASAGLLISVLGVDSRKTIMTTFSSLALLAGLPMVVSMLAGFVARGWHAWALPGGVSPVFTVSHAFEVYYRTSVGSKDYWTSVSLLLAMSLALVVLSGMALSRGIRDALTERSPVASLARARTAGPRLAAALDRNPYEWLVLRGSGEWRLLGAANAVLLVVYGVMLVIAVATSYWREGFITAFFTALAIHVITKLRYAVEATRQIQYDRQSGGLELLRVTPLPERQIIEGHQQGLRALARKPVALMISLNLGLEAWVVLFPTQLHMDHGAGAAFTMVFISGAVLAPADLAAARRLALRHGLLASSHIKAALTTFGWLMVIPWIGFGLGIAILSNGHGGDSTVGVMVAFWAVGSLVYDGIVGQPCQSKLEP